MNWKTWIPLGLALLMGLVAAKIGRDLIVRNRNASAAGGKFIHYVVARQDIEPGKTLGEKDLALSAIAAEQFPRNAFLKPDDVFGRVTIAPVVKNQPIVESSLAPAGSGGGPQAMVPPGMRAVTVEVTESTGVGGLLVPGCHVDVISSLQDQSAQRLIVRTIVQNVRVLAVGQKVGTKGTDEDKGLARSVTLIVTPEQAESIELASSAGRTRLALRSLLDNSATVSKPSAITRLTGESAGNQASMLSAIAGMLKPATQPAVAPATQPRALIAQDNTPVNVFEKPRRPKRTIEVISGSAVSKVDFELPLDPATEVIDARSELPRD